MARIEKVLQGSISVPVLNHTSWLKSGATKKASQKAHKLADLLQEPGTIIIMVRHSDGQPGESEVQCNCSSVVRASIIINNYYGMPFGWTAR